MNGIAPNVLPLVSATDNRTPAGELRFDQSPPAETPWVLGLNSAPVTIWDVTNNANSWPIRLNVTASATGPVPIAPLSNTGLHGAAALLPENAGDPHSMRVSAP